MDTGRKSNFIGQVDAVRKVNLLTMNANETGTLFPHLLILGDTSSGRTTFARAIATRRKVPCEIAEGKALSSPKELLPYLTNIRRGSFLVIRDVDAVNKNVLQFFEKSLRTCRVEICLGEGLHSKWLDLKLPPFTFVAIAKSQNGVSEGIQEQTIPIFFSAYTHEETIRILTHKAFNDGLDLRIDQNIDYDLLSQIVHSVNGSTRRAVAVLTKALAISPKKITHQTLEWIGHAIPKCTMVPGEQRELRIKNMTGVEFEKYLADIFMKKGYSVNLTKASGDHGIDLQIYRSGVMGVVQCKQWEETVGEPHLRDFLGAMVHCGARFGFFVTTSSFTLQAKSFARGKNIQLVDGRQLVTDVDWFL